MKKQKTSLVPMTKKETKRLRIVIPEHLITSIIYDELFIFKKIGKIPVLKSKKKKNINIFKIDRNVKYEDIKFIDIHVNGVRVNAESYLHYKKIDRINDKPLKMYKFSADCIIASTRSNFNEAVLNDAVRVDLLDKKKKYIATVMKL